MADLPLGPTLVTVAELFSEVATITGRCYAQHSYCLPQGVEGCRVVREVAERLGRMVETMPARGDSDLMIDLTRWQVGRATITVQGARSVGERP